MAQGKKVMLRRKSGVAALKVIEALLRLMPLGAIYFIAALFARIGFVVAGRQRKIADESLTLAFGHDKSRQELKKIAQDCFLFMAKSGMELLYLLQRKDLLDKRVRFEGIEKLDKALLEGKGVILVSAHFGNFPLMLARFHSAGYRTNAIIKPMRDAGAEAYFMSKRMKAGINTLYSVPKKQCVDMSLKVLSNNEVLFIPLDQNFGTGGVFVDFFGRKAATATGPVILSRRTKAPILPVFMIRNPDDTHRIVIENPLVLDEGEDCDELILKNVQKITDVIERYIRLYPAEWGWVHRRWKSQPSGTDNNKGGNNG